MAETSSWATQNTGPTGVLDSRESSIHIGGLFLPHTTAIQAKSGFRPGPGTSPGLVSATGTPNGFVHVSPFQLFMQNIRGSGLGVYIQCNDAIKDINILGSFPADPTNPRDDLIVAQQSDLFDADANSDFLIRHVVGTPAAVPADPSISGSTNVVALARVRVAALATTITGSNITDLRTSGHAKSLVGGLHSVALGGLLPVASQAQRDALTGLYSGLQVWRTDTGTVEVYNGSVWKGGWISYTPALTAAGGSPLVGNGVMTGEYKLEGNSCKARGRLLVGSTTNPGTGEVYISTPFTASSVTHVVGPAFFNDSGTAYYSGACIMQSAATKLNFVYAATQFSGVAPFTWAVGDQIIWQVEFPIA